MKVTFKLSNGRSHTHRGRVYVDGEHFGYMVRSPGLRLGSSAVKSGSGR
jgi:hypothetical protein